MKEKEIREYLSNQQLADLLEEWELTIKAEKTPEIELIRELLLYEFEARRIDAFYAWVDSKEEDRKLRQYMI